MGRRATAGTEGLTAFGNARAERVSPIGLCALASFPVFGASFAMMSYTDPCRMVEAITRPMRQGESNGGAT